MSASGARSGLSCLSAKSERAPDPAAHAPTSLRPAHMRSPGKPMSENQITARLKIHDRKLEAFKRVADKCMQSVRTKDSGTLQYDWFFSGDHSECVVHERYHDSKAVLEHNANLEKRCANFLRRALARARSSGLRARTWWRGSSVSTRIYSPYQRSRRPHRRLAGDDLASAYATHTSAGRLHSFAGQLAGLFHPSGELGFVELVLIDVEVAHVLVLGRSRRERTQ
jgi:quinol monooxygenase YgiN